MKKQLNFRQRILVAGTLFGMFFGAGNLIFPVHLGQLAGRNVLPAMLGFIITAVGIPILGVAAIGNTHSAGLQNLAEKVGKRYSYLLTCVLYLTIGPFFAIPRCATTSFTTGIVPMLGEGVSEKTALFLFSFVFFALVLFFSLRPANITVWIGKMINPLFLLFLAILVIAALLHPGTAVSEVLPEQGYQSGALFSAFIEGYGTMDAIAGLAFGIVVIDIIRSMGIEDDAAVAREVLRSGILTGALMAVIYVVTILMGAQSRGLFALSENGGIALAEISQHYLGRAGSLVLALTITFACLKTSIGLVTSCSDAFIRMFPGALSRFFNHSVKTDSDAKESTAEISADYRAWACIFTVFSFVISNFGLSRILDYSLPVLMFLYPLAITLILLALIGKVFEHDRIVYQCVTGFTCFSALFDLIKTLPQGMQSSLHLEGMIVLARKILPWFDLNLGWILPSVLGFVLGMLLHFRSRSQRKE